MKKIISVFYALMSFIVLATTSAPAQGTVVSSHASLQGLLITINIFNPADVVITATGQFSTNNNSSTTAYDGVLLAGFFSADTYINGIMTGSLTGGNSGVAYNAFASDTFYGPDSEAPLGDLDLFDSSSGATNIQIFSTGSSAFAGSVVIDFSSIAGNLSSVGTIGNIYAGNGGANGTSGNLGPIIGQWVIQAVPEPGTNALLALTALGTGLIIYHRRQLIS